MRHNVNLKQSRQILLKPMKNFMGLVCESETVRTAAEFNRSWTKYLSFCRRDCECDCTCVEIGTVRSESQSLQPIEYIKKYFEELGMFGRRRRETVYMIMVLNLILCEICGKRLEYGAMIKTERRTENKTENNEERITQ